MSTTPSSTSGSPIRQGVAVGTTMAAAALLLVAGTVSLFQGIAAVAADDIFVVGIDYTYAFDITAWGWIHVVVGALAIIAALGLFTGATWARVTAIVLASLSIIANFLWMPHYPLWAALVIVLDVVVIWAVATWDSEAL